MDTKEYTKEVLLSPDKVIATEFELVLAHNVSGPTLNIVAKGHAEGVTLQTIKAIDLTAAAPIFSVVGQTTEAIGYFPYTAERTFDVANPDIQEILILSPNGLTAYNVTHLLSGSEEHVVPDAVKSISGNQVVGYAPNQSNLDVAFSNGVNQLYKKFPGHISAKIVDSGFVASGSPVGIAYTYVVLEQQS